MNNHNNTLAVLDAGGQYSHMIARRLREIGVDPKIVPCEVRSNELVGFKGIIISGGPSSVSDAGSPMVDERIFKLGKPVLGICYGHQLMAKVLNGQVQRGRTAEYGIANIRIKNGKGSKIFKTMSGTTPVWMSHGDVVTKVPERFRVLAETEDCPVAAMGNKAESLYGVQFHPEVAHTPLGTTILRNFTTEICHCETRPWRPEREVGRLIQEIQHSAQGKRVLFFVSGGVDSTVAFALTIQALGADRVHGVFVNTGFMRQSDIDDIEFLQSQFKANIRVVSAEHIFLPALANITEPEAKRKRIGTEFVRIHDDVLNGTFGQSESKWMLGQGTIYPDTIESGGTVNAAVIKTHHNRVDRIKELIAQGRVIEPLRDFYKDEVRSIGRTLNLPDRLLKKHPFPGPGLAIRCIASDAAATATTDSAINRLVGPYDFWGMRAPIHSVGVKGDGRCYDRLAIVYGAGKLKDLETVSTKITNQLADVTRVVYHVGSDRHLTDKFIVRRAPVSAERVALLRAIDAAVHTFMQTEAPSEYEKIWQFPVVLLPLSTRARKAGVVLRPVESSDGMTASFSKLPQHVLERLGRHLQDMFDVDVFFDITNKPPATIEWE